MKKIEPMSWKQEMAAFREKTDAFYKGEIKKNEYKGFPACTEAMHRKADRPACFV